MSNAGGAAGEVVVDPVVPDQVPRSQPGEYFRQCPPVEIAPASTQPRLPGPYAGRRQSSRAGSGLVENSDDKAQAGQAFGSPPAARWAAVIDETMPPEQAPRDRVIGAGDLLDTVEHQDAGGVGVDPHSR
jgi:hypothetical protein